VTFEKNPRFGGVLGGQLFAREPFALDRVSL
jgi:hypothetical protein